MSSFKNEISDVLNDVLIVAAENDYGDISQYTNDIMEGIEQLEQLQALTTLVKKLIGNNELISEMDSNKMFTTVAQGRMTARSIQSDKLYQEILKEGLE